MKAADVIAQLRRLARPVAVNPIVAAMASVIVASVSAAALAEYLTAGQPPADLVLLVCLAGIQGWLLCSTLPTLRRRGRGGPRR